MIDISTASAIVVAVSVVLGLGFTMLELRNLARTRRTDVIMRIYDRFGSKEMVEAINSVGQLRSQSLEFPPKEALTGVTQVAIIFEGLGVLLEQNLIDIELVNSLFGPTLVSLWEPIQPVIQGMRKSLKEPFFFSHFEYLYNRLAEYRREHPEPH
ncbi:MAG TPA: hypothetical protein VLY82_08060 [Nitrososphaerales archaeon]|nr:hypothetical protein [Nitrososphaerales archaeon]